MVDRGTGSSIQVGFSCVELVPFFPCSRSFLLPDSCDVQKKTTVANTANRHSAAVILSYRSPSIPTCIQHAGICLAAEISMPFNNERGRPCPRWGRPGTSSKHNTEAQLQQVAAMINILSGRLNATGAQSKKQRHPGWRWGNVQETCSRWAEAGRHRQ